MHAVQFFFVGNMEKKKISTLVRSFSFFFLEQNGKFLNVTEPTPIPRFPWGYYFLMFSLRDRLRIVSNFGDGDCGASEIHTIPSHCLSSKFRARVCVYFVLPTIAIAKIRDYSRSTTGTFRKLYVCQMKVFFRNLFRFLLTGSGKCS